MKGIHSSVAMRTERMIDYQEELDFFWDVRCDMIGPDNRRCWASIVLEDSRAVFQIASHDPLMVVE